MLPLKVILPSEIQQKCYFWNVDCHLGYHGNGMNQSETSNSVTWPCTIHCCLLLFHHLKIGTNWSNMLFLECWLPSWLPWQRNENNQLDTLIEVTWPYLPIASYSSAILVKWTSVKNSVKNSESESHLIDYSHAKIITLMFHCLACQHLRFALSMTFYYLLSPVYLCQSSPICIPVWASFP